MDERDDRRRRWGRRAEVAQGCGLLVGTVGIAVRWGLSGPAVVGLPPGLIILSGATIVVLLLRRPAAVVLGLAAAMVVLAGLWPRIPSLPGRLLSAEALAISITVETVGVAFALLAGLAALALASSGWVTRREARRHKDLLRVGQVLGLLVLAPICAEYLSAYDSSTGHPLQLLAGLGVFIPLYGCPALLIRELARRFGLGWLGILAMATAFGLVQAGVVDQSLFSVDYRGIDGWEETYGATLIPAWGISASNAVNFVAGHAVFSIGAPIAMVEAVAPERAARPWLGRAGLSLAALAYLAASALVLDSSLRTEDSHASVTQVLVSLALVAALVGVAFRLGRPRRPTSVRPAPRIRTVFAAALGVSVAHAMATETWPGVALALGSFVLAGVGIGWASRRAGWRVGHIAVVAAAPLLVRGALAFTYDPLIGTVSAAQKYGHNAAMLVVVLAATALAVRSTRVTSSADVSVPAAAP